MKKTYISPIAEVIKLNYQYSLLTGSLLDVNDEATIVNDIDIVDTGGLLDPESHEFFLTE
jgi:hypothetical protein